MDRLYSSRKYGARIIEASSAFSGAPCIPNAEPFAQACPGGKACQLTNYEFIELVKVFYLFFAFFFLLFGIPM